MCTDLRQVVSQRTVWEEALRTEFTKYSYFEVSYHFESMSVDELRQEALGPHLWRKKLVNLAKTEGTLEPLHRRVIPAANRWEPFRAVNLIPGGRYLLAETARTITLWDLGGLHSGYPQPKCLDTYRIPAKCKFTGLYMAQDGHDSQTLRFLVEVTRRRYVGSLQPAIRIFDR